MLYRDSADALQGCRLMLDTPAHEGIERAQVSTTVKPMTRVPGPVEALERIAYLLERGRAESYKVRACRRAAYAVAALEPEHLRALHKSGRLTQIPAVGETTAKIIAEALSGETPGYLLELERRGGPAWSQTAT